MTDSDEYHWILLQRLGVTSRAVVRLCADDEASAPDAPRRWLSAAPPQLRRRGVSSAACEAIAEWQHMGRAHAADRQAVRDCDWLAAAGARLLHLGHPDYPPLLREIPDPPAWLYVMGDVALLSRPQLAMVGSRRPSRQGLDDARAFAGALGGAGFVITSGMAYGIDAAAHTAALAADGSTIAVLGTGLDRVYPRRHADLARTIAAHGALVSEQPLGAPPLAGHFPRRNRIISGLSLGVLVVEAAMQSGSLVTARLALEQNREVYALPGSIHNPASRGCNALIRQGATLVQTVADICDELAGWRQPVVPSDLPALVGEGTAEAVVLEALGYEPMTLELIVERAGLGVAGVMAALAELELIGSVAADDAGWSRRSTLASTARLG